VIVKRLYREHPDLETGRGVLLCAWKIREGADWTVLLTHILMLIQAPVSAAGQQKLHSIVGVPASDTRRSVVF
ncbi:MAG: hypothetical protein V7772_19130, partial [Pseudomonas profundi]|uniref:hypothetical protein n=1 Tax=Pseudomonas profundi TaxID=1981513 RepID=UPI003001C90F